MFAIEVDRLIATLYESMRPAPEPSTGFGGFGVREPGMVFTLDLRLDYYALSTDEYHRSALAFVLLTGNTSVFVATTTEHKRWFQMEGSQWENTSNHDSCWRTDGFRFLSSLYFDMSEQMGQEMKAHGHNAIAPKEYSQFCSLGTIAGPPFEKVWVDHQRVPGESYRRRLVKVAREDQPDYLPGVKKD